MVTKHLVRWVDTKYVWAGKKIISPYGKEIDLHYRGTLLSRILSMKKQIPISYEDAIQLLIQHEAAAYKAGRKGCEPGEYVWFQYNFLEWLSEIGYHIEVTGDEFEPIVMSDQVA